MQAATAASVAAPAPGGNLGHTGRVRTAAYPGSFDPPTVAHLAVAEAARRRFDLERVDLVLSEVALGKEAGHAVHLDDRVAVLRRAAAGRPWLGAAVSPHRLLVDVAAGYDVVVVGADKWAQVTDPRWYTSARARDEALARLPTVAVAPRDGFEVPRGLVVLDVDPAHGAVSSTSVRAGAHDWMLAEAAAFATETGAWLDASRYERWRCLRQGARPAAT